MVQPLTFEERAELLGLSIPRARFLAACSHVEGNKGQANKTDPIPYDESILIAEAHRIGLGLRDTAKMMGMTRNEVIAFGLFFPTKSAFNKPPGMSIYNLFPPEPIKPDVCFR